MLIPADDEPAVVVELRARLAVPVSTVIPSGSPPKARPAEFVRVVSAGGAQRDLVSDAMTVAVEGFAESEARARRLCAEAVGYLQAAGRDGVLGGEVCYGVQVFGLPANLPHPLVPDRFRYTATVSVELRRVAL